MKLSFFADIQLIWPNCSIASRILAAYPDADGLRDHNPANVPFLIGKWWRDRRAPCERIGPENRQPYSIRVATLSSALGPLGGGKGIGRFLRAPSPHRKTSSRATLDHDPLDMVGGGCARSCARGYNPPTANAWADVQVDGLERTERTLHFSKRVVTADRSS